MTVRLNDGTVVLWRSNDSVQLELGSRRIVLDNVRDVDLLGLLPPRYSASLRARTAKRGSSNPLPPGPSRDVTDALLDTGLLVEVSVDGDPDPAEHDSPVGHLAAEMATLHERFGTSARAVLAARSKAAVAVYGASRIAVPIAATLAAAGIGQVQLVHSGDVSAAQTCPGGLVAADEGKRFSQAGSEAIHRVAPQSDTTAIAVGRKADLTVLTDSGPIEPALARSLHLDELVHLNVAVDGELAVIGPLVRPGITSCLRCADLTRTDRDPQWPLLAMQLTMRPAHRVSSDTALCVASAGLAAAQVLAVIDGTEAATANATLEWSVPDWALRRRSWPPHPRCGCGAASGGRRTVRPRRTARWRE